MQLVKSAIGKKTLTADGNVAQVSSTITETVMSVFKPVHLLNNINRKKEGSYSDSLSVYKNNWGEGWSSSPSWPSGFVWWSCLSRCQREENVCQSHTNPSFHLNLLCARWTCNCCTYMTWTTTPIPDTASLSTAFSIAWEMVSNRSSGSCTYKQIEFLPF